MGSPLLSRAESGDAAAQRALAYEMGAGRWDKEAIRWMIRAANGGDLGAMTAIGRWMLVGQNAPLDPRRGAAMILAAAETGHAPALTLSAVVHGAGLAGAPDWGRAIQALEAASALGDTSARGQLAALAGVADQLIPPPAEPIASAPRLWWVKGLAPPTVCDWLKDRANGRLDLATVYDTGSGKLEAQEIRTNSLFEFDLAETDLVVLWLRQRIAQAFGVPVNRLEASNVLHYTPGQQFGRHFDFLQPRAPGLVQELATKGQRVATALIYLNDDFKGGETDFPRLNRSFKGAPGDGLFFWNVSPAGEPDVESLHAGLRTTTGVKWLFSQFVRDRRQGGEILR